MGQAGAVAPVLTYLFHRLEERFNSQVSWYVAEMQSA
jgi:type IV secretory pathway VirB4 component